MKTTQVEITPEITQMIVNLVDAGMKHPEFGGARLAMPGAVVLQWLQPVQERFNAMGNGEIPAEQIPEVAATGSGRKRRTPKKPTDLEGKT